MYKIRENESMEDLKELLSRLKEDSNKEDVKTTFCKIAEELLYKSQIVTSYGKYRILEIEFYFFNPNHKDTVTIPREEEPGMWWLHDWGVDISLKSEKTYYGGILIRSLHNEDEDKYILGPKKCCWELFYSSAVIPAETPHIEKKYYKGEAGTKKRVISGANKGINEDYRYYAQEIDGKKMMGYKESPWKK